MLNDQSSFTDKKSRKKYLVCTLGFFLTKNKNVLLMSTELKQNVYICIFKKTKKEAIFCTHIVVSFLVSEQRDSIIDRALVSRPKVTVRTRPPVSSPLRSVHSAATHRPATQFTANSESLKIQKKNTKS